MLHLPWSIDASHQTNAGFHYCWSFFFHFLSTQHIISKWSQVSRIPVWVSKHADQLTCGRNRLHDALAYFSFFSLFNRKIWIFKSFIISLLQAAALKVFRTGSEWSTACPADISRMERCWWSVTFVLRTLWSFFGRFYQVRQSHVAAVWAVVERVSDSIRCPGCGWECAVDPSFNPQIRERF